MLSFYHYKQFTNYYPNSYCFILLKPVFATVDLKFSGRIVSWALSEKINIKICIRTIWGQLELLELHSMVRMVHLPRGPPRDDGCLQCRHFQF